MRIVLVTNANLARICRVCITVSRLKKLSRGIALGGLLLISAQFTAAQPVQANNAVLSPAGAWDLQIAAPGQACNISNSFNRQISIRLHAAKGVLKSLFLRFEGGAFDPQEVYTLGLSAPSGAALTLPAKAVSSNDVFIQLPEDSGLDAFLSSTPVVTLSIAGQASTLDLKGISVALPQLQVCQREAPVVSPAQQPKASVIKEQMQAYPASQEGAAVNEQQAVQSSGSALKINPYPLDPEKNKAALKALEQGDVDEAQTDAVADAKTVPVTRSAADPIVRRNKPQVQPEPKSAPDAPSIVKKENASKNSALQDDVELSTQNSEVQSTVSADVNSSSNEPALPQLPLPQASDAVSDPSRLIRPPVMDRPLPSPDDVQPQQDMAAEVLVEDKGAVAVPEGVIVNNEAQLYVTDAANERVMQKNDEAEEVQASARPSGRSGPGILSQTHEMASVEPVIIPSVPEVALPTRFDLMNRGAAIDGQPKVAAEPARQIRNVSNEFLEQQMKNALQDGSVPVISMQNTSKDGADPEIMEQDIAQKGGKTEIKADAQPNPVPEQVKIPDPVAAHLHAKNSAQGVQPKTQPETEKMQPSGPSSESLPSVAAPVVAADVKAGKDAGVEAGAETGQKWVASAGADLRTVLAEWSLTEGADLIWDSEDQFKLPVNIQSGQSYERTVSGLLRQYGSAQAGQPRPRGELYVDPDTGKRVLIIRSAR